MEQIFAGIFGKYTASQPNSARTTEEADRGGEQDKKGRGLARRTGKEEEDP